MKTKATWFGLLAFAVAVSVPGLAAAVNDIFDDASCPLPDQIVLEGFNANDVRDGVHSVADPDALPSDWDEFGDVNEDETIDIDDVRDEIPFYVTLDLIAKIVSDVERPNSEDVCDCVLANMQRAALDTPLLQDGVQEPTYWADKLFAAIVISGSDLTSGWEDAFDIAEDFSFQLSPESGYCNLGDLLSGGGDADDDGDTNLEEWQAAVDNYTFGTDSFEELVAEFVNAAAPSTVVVVSISGPGELLWGQPAETFTADTIIPMEDMMTTDDTSYDWSVTGPAEIVGPASGLSADITATGADSVTITAEGNNSGASGSVTLQARIPKWFEICSIDEAILIQTAGVAEALGCELGFTRDPESLDIEFLVGATMMPPDFTLGGAPDLFQMLLGAYTICAEAKPGAQAAWDNNLGGVEDYFVDLQDTQDLFVLSVAEVDVNPNTLSIDEGDMETLTVVTEVDGTMTADAYLFDSDDDMIATVDGSGEVTGVDEGTTEITVTSLSFGQYGAIATVTVHVDDPTTNNVSISGAADLNLGDEVTFTASTVGPNDDETYTIDTDDDTVVTVDGGMEATGVTSVTIDAVGIGTATITAEGDDSGIMATLAVEVFSGAPCDEADDHKGEDSGEVPIDGPVGDARGVIGLWLAGAATQMAGIDATSAANITAVVEELSGTTPGPATALLGADAALGALLGFESATEYLAMAISTTSESAGFHTAVLNAEVDLGDGDLAAFGGLSGAAPLGLSEFASALVDIKTELDMHSPFTAMTPLDLLDDLVTAALADPAITGLPGTLPSIVIPTPDIVGSDLTKVAGIESLDDGSIYAPDVNPQDLTNEQIATSVQNAGGSGFDFVNIAAGIDILTAVGSPFLPAAGALGLGILAGGLAFAAAMRLRRRNA